jgi:peptide/nickel transport system substrate-binding protein
MLRTGGAATAYVALRAGTTAPRTAAAQTRPGLTITSALTADPRSFDPAFTQGVAGREATRLFYDALVNVDGSGRLVPGLAERWDQPDAKTYVLHLRQGVKFHDGTVFDAAAVKAHFDHHLDPANKSLRRGEITSIDTVSVVDAHTVRIALKEPFAAFLAPLADLSGFIESPAARQQYGREFGARPVGTGPFRLVEYQKDVHTVAERNPAYWRAGFPKADTVVLRPIPVDTTRLTEARTGGVQIASDPPFQDIRRLRGSSDVVLSEKQGFRWDYMAFNQTKGVGANRAFRQAVNRAIDREAIHNVVYFGTGAVAYDPFLPGTPFHDPAYRPITRDVGEARKLIDGSGVKTPVALQVAVTPDPVKQRVVQIVQQNLAEIGIEISLTQTDAAAHTALIEAGDFTFDPGWGWFGYRPDPDQYLYILTRTKGSRNIGRYSSPLVDQLLTTERSVLAQSERRQAFRRIAELLTEDAVYISYHYGSDFKVRSPRLQNFVHRQDGIIRYDELTLA